MKRKVRRRDFLKLAAATSAGAVIWLYTRDIARAFEQATSGDVHVVWLQGAGDTGCTVSLLQGSGTTESPDLVDVIRRFRHRRK